MSVAGPKAANQARLGRASKTSNRVGRGFDRCNGCRVGFHWISDGPTGADRFSDSAGRP
jgi:hypothetical protein